jgi:signal transduction histidine kinase/PAS domain-containing protein
MNIKIKFGILTLAASLILILTAYLAFNMPGVSQTAPLKLYTPALAQTSEPPAPPPLVLTDGQSEYPLGLHLELLEDPSGGLTIEDVTSPEFSSQFIPSRVEVPNYGFTDSAYWVRLRLDNQTRSTNEWLLEQGFANTHYIDLYTPLPGGTSYAVKQAGILRPTTPDDVHSPRVVLKLTVPPQSQQTFYLRVKNGASMTLSLTLWKQAAFLNYSLLEQMWTGVFYGVLIGLLLYNLFLLFSLRELAYFYFVILLAAFIIEESSYDGYLRLYGIANLNLPIQYIQPLSFSLLIASMVLFSDAFLETKARFPKIHRVNLVILAVGGALMLLTPFTSYHLMAIPIISWAIFSLVAIFNAGLSAWINRYRPVRFFMLAWLGLLASLLWVLLVRLAFVPSTSLSENIYRLGYVWMAVCWSIALADRINLLKDEAESANRDLQNSEHRLSQILEGLPLGIVVYGKDYKPKYANRRSVEMLSDPSRGIQADLSAERTLDEAILYFSIQVSGSRQEYPVENLPVFTALQGKTGLVDDVEIEHGGERVALEIQASPVRDDAGSVESAVVAIQDITQRKKAEAELIEYRKQLEKIVEERTTEIRAINERLNYEIEDRMSLEQTQFKLIEWLSAKNEVQQSINKMADLPQVYEVLLDRIIRLSDANSTFIGLWSKEGEQLQMVCYPPPNGSTEPAKKMSIRLHNDTHFWKLIKHGKLTILPADQTANLPASMNEIIQMQGIRSIVLAPMNSRQGFTAVLGLGMNRSIDAFKQEDRDLIERMATDLEDLAEYAFLYEKTRFLIAEEERNRLARDLHDSVTQVLFSANLLAEVLPQIWRRNPEEGLQKLESLRRLTRGALAEMRTMLLELRPAALVNTPLPDLLAQLTEAYFSRSGLQFRLYLEKVPSLPEDVHIAYYRIAQEALNNVVKHSQAKEVIIVLNMLPLEPGSNGEQGYEIKLVIQDDGVGYSRVKAKPTSLGIGFMYERAANIHADLSLESQPGYGTEVTLVWQNESEER